MSNNSKTKSEPTSTMETTNKKKKKRRVVKKKSTMNDRKIFLNQQYLKREVKMTAYNTTNFRSKWRKLLMKIRMPEINQKVEIEKNTFDRALDIKCYSEQLTMEWLEKCEVQRRRNVAKHIEANDKFISIYCNRLDAANDFYKNNLTTLMNDFTRDTEKIKFVHDDDEIMFHTIIYENEQRIKAIRCNVDSEMTLKLENIRNDGENLTKTLMLHLEEKLSSKRKYLNRIISTYFNGIHYRRLYYEDLKKKDILDRKIIAHQLFRTEQLYKSIQLYKDKISKLNEDANEIVAVSAKRKHQLCEANQSLIKQFNNEQKIDKFQLHIQTMNYNHAIKHLQLLVKRTHVMLFLIQRCRMFQMQSEKILPVQLDQTNVQSSDFDFFWYRVGLAHVIAKDLKREREVLKRERCQLYESLKYRIIYGLDSKFLSTS